MSVATEAERWNLREDEVLDLEARFPVYVNIILRGGLKGVAANLEYRSWVRKRALEDEGFRAREIGRCRADPLYYFNVYCWTYIAKDAEAWGLPQTAPFITWPYQDRWFAEVYEHLYTSDIGTDKSRDMGATWMSLHVIEHQWAFEVEKTFLLVSRVEDSVDKADEPDCLMWKLDFIQKHKPFWMRPRVKRSHLKMLNVDTGSSVTGTSTSANASRGGRKAVIFLDEFAAVPKGEEMLRATQQATNCRMFNSTPMGQENTFYAVMHNMPGIVKTRMHWSDHPHKAKGLYLDERGKFRSPWYDLQCERTPHPRDIAQELDIDYAGSDETYFNADSLDAHIAKHCRPPITTGRIEYDLRGRRVVRGRFISGYETGHKDPPMRLWCELDSTGSVADDLDYALGIDISAGTGVTPSCISVVCKQTRRKVAEWADPDTRPSDLARVAVGIAKIFNSALICWECNGSVGQIFTTAIVELGYFNLFHALQLEGWDQKETGKLGWHSNTATKRVALEAYRLAIHHPGTSFINPSKIALDECRMYVFVTPEVVAHAQSHSTDDPSGAKANHGDRAMADVIANIALERLSPIGDEFEEPEQKMTIMDSMAARREEYERERHEEQYEW